MFFRFSCHSSGRHDLSILRKHDRVDFDQRRWNRKGKDGSEKACDTISALVIIFFTLFSCAIVFYYLQL